MLPMLPHFFAFPVKIKIKEKEKEQKIRQTQKRGNKGNTLQKNG